ncbi:MAG: anaerobic ribonucleoside-triphosphate reductase activating protein [Lachnospiraceae bacterium]|nr:anaerobic ribonucleoside-triphosphate reductase activating protein [Lachnospiraceae bacterium]
MKFGQIFECDIANGEGCRTSLFVSGCTHHCKECFNPETWDFNFGDEYTQSTEDFILDSLRPEYIRGLTILGGEPMEPRNQVYVRKLVERVKKEIDHADIWIYSGYTIEELTDPGNKRCHTGDTMPILQCTDILVDGEFHIAEKNIMLKFRGSSNQRIIDVKATLEKNGNGEDTVVLAEQYMGREN